MKSENKFALNPCRICGAEESQTFYVDCISTARTPLIYYHCYCESCYSDGNYNTETSGSTEEKAAQEWNTINPTKPNIANPPGLVNYTKEDITCPLQGMEI